SEEHTSELQSLTNLVCRLLLEKKKCPETSACVQSMTKACLREPPTRNGRTPGPMSTDSVRQASHAWLLGAPYALLSPHCPLQSARLPACLPHSISVLLFVHLCLPTLSFPLAPHRASQPLSSLPSPFPPYRPFPR